MRSMRFVSGFTLFLLWAPLIARAEATYQYDGNPFQSVVGRYSTSDSLSGTVQLPLPLAPNLANAAITLDGWSFSDGLKVFTPANSSIDSPRVSTDADGRIVNWSFDFSNPTVGVMGSFDNGPFDQIDPATDFTGGNSLASNGNSRGAGRWFRSPRSARSPRSR